MNEIIRDNGYRSRKLAFSVFAIAVIFGAWLLAGCKPALVPMFDTFVGGVIAIVGLFLTGSVATKFVGLKAPADPKPVVKQQPLSEAEIEARLPPEAP